MNIYILQSKSSCFLPERGLFALRLTFLTVFYTLTTKVDKQRIKLMDLNKPIGIVLVSSSKFFAEGISKFLEMNIKRTIS